VTEIEKLEKELEVEKQREATRKRLLQEEFEKKNNIHSK